MSGHTIKHITCDRCGDKTSIRLEKTYGGHCHWLHIEKNWVKSDVFTDNVDMSCDLCETCADALIEFMKGSDVSK